MKYQYRLLKSGNNTQSSENRGKGRWRDRKTFLSHPFWLIHSKDESKLHQKINYVARRIKKKGVGETTECFYFQDIIGYHFINSWCPALKTRMYVRFNWDLLLNKPVRFSMQHKTAACSLTLNAADLNGKARWSEWSCLDLWPQHRIGRRRVTCPVVLEKGGEWDAFVTLPGNCFPWAKGFAGNFQNPDRRWGKLQSQAPFCLSGGRSFLPRSFLCLRWESKQPRLIISSSCRFERP